MKIDKSVPVPRRAGPGSRRYPWSSMAVGDSIFFDDAKMASRARCAAFNWGRVRGAKFSMRAVEGGWRVWRVT